jgi:hypothetical protein
MMKRMMKWKEPVRLAAILLSAALFSGCVSVYNVGMAGKTPTAMGKIKLYSTDNVPFVYEEVGFLSVRVDGSPVGPPAQDYVLQVFHREAAKTGADAVVNFKIEEAFWSDWLFFPGGSCAVASGTAVSIVRP